MKQSKFLPAIKKRTLKKTLSYMNGNLVCKVCDFLNGILLIGYIAVSMIFSTADTNVEVKGALIAVGILLWGIAWHFVLSYLDENWQRYVNVMLVNSKEYYDYKDEKEFETYVDKSLRNNMIFRTRRLVLTKDCVLGTKDRYNGFSPVVILRKEVEGDSFYEEEHWNWVNRRQIHTVDGILELRIKGGNIIRLWVSEGSKNKGISKLLTESRQLGK